MTSSHIADRKIHHSCLLLLLNWTSFRPVYFVILKTCTLRMACYSEENVAFYKLIKITVWNRRWRTESTKLLILIVIYHRQNSS